MNQVVLVFVGGGLGSLARYGVGKAFEKWPSAFPLGTLMANIIACLILGIFAGWATMKSSDSLTNYRAFVAVGFCGGFSTFSTFSNDTIQLMISNRPADALINVLTNVLLCFGATLLGMWIGK